MDQVTCLHTYYLDKHLLNCMTNHVWNPPGCSAEQNRAPTHREADRRVPGIMCPRLRAPPQWHAHGWALQGASMEGPYQDPRRAALRPSTPPLQPPPRHHPC